MKAQLIILENPIIVTDELPKEGDFVLSKLNEIVLFGKKYDPSFYKKVINKPIDYNGIDFGIVDVEKLAMDKLKIKWAHLYTFGYPQKPYPTNYESDLNLIKVGIYESQQLNEKKFTLDDLRDAFKSGECYGKTWSEFYNTDSVSRAEAERTSDFNDFIRELSLPKTFYIEIEETENLIKILKK